MTGSPSRGRVVVRAGALLLTLGAVATGCLRISITVSRPPVPEGAACPLPGADHPALWKMAQGRLPEGCSTKGPVESPVACLHARSDEEGFDRGRVSDFVGGDYWKVPVDDTGSAACWMQTGKAASEIASPPFSPSARWLSFSIRRPKDSHTRVELREDDHMIAATTRDAGGPTFTRVTWDLDALFPGPRRGRRVRLHLVDEDPESKVELADISVSPFPPPPKPQGVIDPRDKLWGIADLHAHFFSSMAFGGQVFWGNVHSAVNSRGFVGPKGPSDPRVAVGDCGAAHGEAPLSDGVLFLMPPEQAHSRLGYPRFLGFPTHETVYHQQAYVDWIRRAFYGGLRVVQMDALNYPFLKKMNDVSRGANPSVPENPIDDQWNIDRQLQAAVQFADLPDVKSFLAIARTASEARQIVRGGRLAMILGTETETLGDMEKALANKAPSDDPRRIIESHLGCLYERGARHLIPVHLSENALGAPAVYQVEFDLGQAAVHGKHFDLRVTKPEEGIFYSRDKDWAEANSLIKFLTALQIANASSVPRGPDIPEPPRAGHAHARGLTPAGEVLFLEMMRRGMIIDVEHLSALSTDKVLSLAERFHYPVISSHTSFRAIKPSPNEAKRAVSWSSERSRSAAELDRITRLGGLIGLGTGPAATREEPGIADCDGSSTGFVSELRYANKHLAGGAVALGTDINGLGGQLGPRFGPRACMAAGDDKARMGWLGRQREAQRNGVAYSPGQKLVRHDQERFSAGNRSAQVDGREIYLTETERRAWQSIARLFAGVGESLSAPGDRDPDPVKKYARGLHLARTTTKIAGNDARDPDIQAGYWACMSVVDACKPIAHKPLPRDLPIEVRRTAITIGAAFLGFLRMNGQSPPLRRSILGDADFDFNLDGLAHYGLIPDMLQDVKNQGVTEEELAPLFRSAEAYVELWERSERAAIEVNKALPPSYCAQTPGLCRCK